MAREKGMGNLQQEKSGRYTVRFSVDGLHYARSTRTRDKARAEDFLDRLLAPYGRGAQRLPLAEVWRAYEKSPRRREQTPSTLATKRVIWMKFADWLAHDHLEITHLRQLSVDIIAEYLRVFRLGHAASTYNNHICALREIFRCVAPKAGVTQDPWRDIRLLPDDSHTRREFSLDELRRIQCAAEQLGGEWPLLVTIGIYTGLRLGDCCRLTWENIDLNRGIIQLLPHKTRKFGRMVTIPIHPELLRHLIGRAGSPLPAAFQNDYNSADGRAASPLAAASTSLPFHSSTSSSTNTGLLMPEIARLYLTEHWRIDNALKSLFSAAGIRTSIRLEGRRQDTPDATFHSLRHTFVSFAANAGIPLAVVATIVGHSSTSMTRHYYHANEQALRKAIAAIPSLTQNAAPPEPPTDLLPRRPRHPATSIAKRLKKLMHLSQKGLITPSEYTTLRTRILEDI